jgi:glycine cleavage system H protein
LTGNKGKVGVTEYAQKEISDVVFVELARKGHAVAQGKAASVVESVKAAFDIYAPLAGVISDFNQALESNPGLVNQDPYGAGWLFELEVTDPSALNTLMTAAQYAEFIQSGAGH